MVSLLELPPDVLRLLLRFLDPCSVALCREVCHRMLSLCPYRHPSRLIVQVTSGTRMANRYRHSGYLDLAWRRGYHNVREMATEKGWNRCVSVRLEFVVTWAFSRWAEIPEVVAPAMRETRDLVLTAASMDRAEIVGQFLLHLIGGRHRQYSDLRDSVVHAAARYTSLRVLDSVCRWGHPISTSTLKIVLEDRHRETLEWLLRTGKVPRNTVETRMLRDYTWHRTRNYPQPPWLEWCHGSGE